MVLNNIHNVNLKNHQYYTLKEFSYFMLANQIYKSQNEDNARFSAMDNNLDSILNQNLRSNIFRNQF